MRDLGPLPVESLQGSRTHRTVGCLAASAPAVRLAFLQQAKGRGQLRPDLDLEVGIDIIWAPLYYRLLLHYAPLDEAHAAAVVDAALTGLAVRSD